MSKRESNSVLPHLQRLPLGYAIGIYRGKKYGISKSVFNHGKSCKIYAEELGGTDVISLNFYQTSQQERLNPCEMSERKVRAFLEEIVLIGA